MSFKRANKKFSSKKKFSSNGPSKGILLQCQKSNSTKDFISGKKIADQIQLGSATYNL